MYVQSKDVKSAERLECDSFDWALLCCEQGEAHHNAVHAKCNDGYIVCTKCGIYCPDEDNMSELHEPGAKHTRRHDLLEEYIKNHHMPQIPIPAPKGVPATQPHTSYAYAVMFNGVAHLGLGPPTSEARCIWTATLSYSHAETWSLSPCLLVADVAVNAAFQHDVCRAS